MVTWWKESGNSRDVVFNEKIFYKTNLQVPKKFHKTNNFQFEVENANQDKVSGGNCGDLQGANLENDQLRADKEIAGRTDDMDQTDTEQNGQVANDDDEHNDGHNLRNYMLAKDRVRREIRFPSKYAYIDIIAYALNIGDTIELDEPVTFTKVSKS